MFGYLLISHSERTEISAQGEIIPVWPTSLVESIRSTIPIMDGCNCLWAIPTLCLSTRPRELGECSHGSQLHAVLLWTSSAINWMTRLYLHMFISRQSCASRFETPLACAPISRWGWVCVHRSFPCGLKDISTYFFTIPEDITPSRHDVATMI